MNENQIGILKCLLDLHFDQYCWYSAIARDTGLDIETVRKEMRVLRDMKLVELKHGLISEDGCTAGSGHQIVYEMRGHCQKIIEAYDTTLHGLMRNLKKAFRGLLGVK